MAIHPGQVAPINAVFSPTAAELSFAQRVIGAFAKAEAEGLASIQLDGRFIDYPIVEAAQRLLTIAQAMQREP
jgi:citrate lyase subunit beta/citryl-CoA lyase